MKYFSSRITRISTKRK